ncbi:hypothetical protein K438DRAFT_1755575 [Mycena galopus ATCC 62051]|nr:hypothetical protein K438DRAFT_1755575 [Mycena galopus ATCC 62051]
MENTLRDAQCLTALENLRCQLHIKSRYFTYKELQARHQGANTRARALVEWNESKIRLHSEKYQMAWEARRCLADGDVERVGWHILKKEDIRAMEDAEELARAEEKRKGQTERQRLREAQLRRDGELPPLTREERECEEWSGESVREVLWIWTGVGMTGADTELNEAVRVEWCKAYARTRRWDKVRLLQEEEHRMGIPVGREESEGWSDAVGTPGTWTVERAEGAIAYTLKQAARVKISMMEERRGQGKKRRLVNDDEWVNEDGVAENVSGEWDEDKLDDLRDDRVADDDYLLGDGADMD